MGNRPQWGFLFLQERCNGCKTCEIACKDFHGLEGGLALRTIYEYSGGTWVQDEQGAWHQDVFSFYLSVSCNHCGNPLCMRFCPAGGITKDEHGYVTIDAQKCVGCQVCTIACPYHTPRFDSTKGVTVKCDGCEDRMLMGLNPVCVDACPQRALSVGDPDEIFQDADMVPAIVPLPDPVLTQPNLAIRACAAAHLADSRPGSLANVYEV